MSYIEQWLGFTSPQDVVVVHCMSTKKNQKKQTQQTSLEATPSPCSPALPARPLQLPV